jgi:TetR/AcrR family transcriptional regulator
MVQRAAHPRSEDRKRDPARTRERILDAAHVEFSEHGYAGRGLVRSPTELGLTGS